MSSLAQKFTITTLDRCDWRFEQSLPIELGHVLSIQNYQGRLPPISHWNVCRNTILKVFRNGLCVWSTGIQAQPVFRMQRTKSQLTDAVTALVRMVWAHILTNNLQKMFSDKAAIARGVSAPCASNSTIVRTKERPCSSPSPVKCRKPLLHRLPPANPVILTKLTGRSIASLTASYCSAGHTRTTSYLSRLCAHGAEAAVTEKTLVERYDTGWSEVLKERNA